MTRFARAKPRMPTCVTACARLQPSTVRPLPSVACNAHSLHAMPPGERVLDTPDNPISVGMTLSTLATPAPASSDDAVTFFGSMLFSRCVSGTRTVPRGKRLEVGGIVFDGYGAHHDGCV